MNKVIKVGGSFAPPITAAQLAQYKEIASLATEQVREVMLNLIKMVEVFQQTPRSSLASDVGPVGIGMLTPLENEEIQRIWDLVPWDYECDAYQGLFERIPPDSQVRTPAFHLLWYARELTMDREPMTNDML